MRIPAIAGVVMLLSACALHAQDRPTNSAQEISVEVAGGAVGYDPEIGTVFDGVIHDIRVTVSEDLRYVQINIGSGLSSIIEIDDFVVITD
jgi:hypothetical protein